MPGLHPRGAVRDDPHGPVKDVLAAAAAAGKALASWTGGRGPSTLKAVVLIEGYQHSRGWDYHATPTPTVQFFSRGD